MVALADGSLATSPVAAVARWREFARLLHNGKQVDVQELLTQADSVIDEFKDIARAPAAIPTLPETGKLYSRLKHGSRSSLRPFCIRYRPRPP